MSAVVPSTLREELEEARESLSYWERRERAVGRGRGARARRSEAREHVESCRSRVAELERALYGTGARGALVLLAEEGRLPEAARHAGRTLARRGRTALVVTAVVAVTVTLVVLAVVIALAIAVLGVA